MLGIVLGCSLVWWAPDGRLAGGPSLGLTSGSRRRDGGLVADFHGRDPLVVTVGFYSYFRMQTLQLLQADAQRQAAEARLTLL